MSDIHPDRECFKTCQICDKSLGARRRMHIPQDPKERMLWAVKKYRVPQDACICANCALQIKLGYQEPSTLYEPSKEDDSAASEEDTAEAQELESEAQNNVQGQRLPDNVPSNTCYLARYSKCEDSAVWNVAAPDWGSFSATFGLENYKEEELPHNFSVCHAHYCQHTSFRIPKCALCHKKTTILRTNGQLFMKAYKLTPAMERYCRTNRVKMVIAENTRLCTRCYQKVGQQVNNPKKLILPRMVSTVIFDCFIYFSYVLIRLSLCTAGLYWRLPPSVPTVNKKNKL